MTVADIEFHEDLRHLECLADAILEAAQLNALDQPDLFPDWVAHPLLQMIAIPIESTTFWKTWDWDDHAARLLINWRFEKALGLGPHHVSDIA